MAVELDAALLEILACPCPRHAELRVGTAADPRADVLSCVECGRRYPVTDGIPVLLLDEADPPFTGAQPAAPGAG